VSSVKYELGFYIPEGDILHDSALAMATSFNIFPVPLPLGSQTVPRLTYQRLAATAYND
jgi:hypothetical protein